LQYVAFLTQLTGRRLFPALLDLREPHRDERGHEPGGRGAAVRKLDRALGGLVARRSGGVNANGGRAGKEARVVPRRHRLARRPWARSPRLGSDLGRRPPPRPQTSHGGRIVTRRRGANADALAPRSRGAENPPRDARRARRTRVALARPARPRA